MGRAPKKNIFSLKIFIRWFVFVEKKILISLNSLIWKTKSTNKYWFENSSTNSTNQRIKFSLICKNFDEFSTKIPINQPNFQLINHNFQSIGQFRTKFQRIRRFFENFRWSVEIFVDSLKFSLKIRWNFVKSTKILFVDSLNSFRWFRWFVEFLEKINENKKQ